MSADHDRNLNEALLAAHRDHCRTVHPDVKAAALAGIEEAA